MMSYFVKLKRDNENFIDQFFMIKLFLTAINTINRGYEIYPASRKPSCVYGYPPTPHHETLPLTVIIFSSLCSATAISLGSQLFPALKFNR